MTVVYMARAQCSTCCAVVCIDDENPITKKQLRTLMRSRGWWVTTRARRAYCPACIALGRGRPRKSQEVAP